MPVNVKLPGGFTSQAKPYVQFFQCPKDEARSRIENIADEISMIFVL